VIPKSGLALADEYIEFDVERRMNVPVIGMSESSECEGGLILQGLKRPSECAAFGHRCTPDHPLGPPMVSSEGACAAYYRYGNLKTVHFHEAGSVNHES
jgi:hydrogenase expression/formation protein HypD